jgi:hypothetical protein
MINSTKSNKPSMILVGWLKKRIGSKKLIPIDRDSFSTLDGPGSEIPYTRKLSLKQHIKGIRIRAMWILSGKK